MELNHPKRRQDKLWHKILLFTTNITINLFNGVGKDNRYSVIKVWVPGYDAQKIGKGAKKLC